MSTQLTHNTNKLFQGAHEIAQAVAVTLGPRGKNVAIDEGFRHRVVHDGVTVSKSITFKDKEKNLGASIMREAAQKQVSQVGDGTTVVTVLADSLLSSLETMISTGVHPMSIREDLESAVPVLHSKIESLSKKVETLDDLKKIATVSAEDKPLGELIAQVVWKMGSEGVVSIEESRSSETYVEYQDGMQFDTGYLSPYFMTDVERGTASVENAAIWITDESITSMVDVLPFINRIITNHKNLVIIAPEISPDCLAAFIENKLRGSLNILCVRAPLFGDHQRNFLMDIASLTGAQVISSNTGVTYDTAGSEALGMADQVTSTKSSTTIIGGKGNEEFIKKHVKGLKKLLDSMGSSFEKEKVRERIAKLSSGVAVIRVGGHTQVEMAERRERVDDAVHASRAALRSGIVLGGETIYLKVRDSLKQTPAQKALYEALEKPFSRLVENAGLNSGRCLEMMKQAPEGMAFDVTKCEGHSMSNLAESGIYDPTEVSMSAIQNAVSVVVQLITTGAVITPEEDRDLSKLSQ